MAGQTKSIQAINVKWILAALAADAIGLAILAHPELDFGKVSAIAWVKLFTTGGASVLILAVAYCLGERIKEILVFWRIRHALPSHRAFSVHALRPMVRLEGLKKIVGEFPTAPQAQTDLWYQLYLKAQTNVRVAGPSRNYLLFRDLAATSYLLAVIVPVIMLLATAPLFLIEVAAGALVVQGFIVAQAARSQGIRLVVMVLSVHSQKAK